MVGWCAMGNGQRNPVRGILPLRVTVMAVGAAVLAVGLVSCDSIQYPIEQQRADYQEWRNHLLEVMVPFDQMWDVANRVLQNPDLEAAPGAHAMQLSPAYDYYDTHRRTFSESVGSPPASLSASHRRTLSSAIADLRKSMDHRYNALAAIRSYLFSVYHPQQYSYAQRTQFLSTYNAEIEREADALTSAVAKLVEIDLELLEEEEKDG